MNVVIKPTREFPLLKRYKAKFAVQEGTIFAYDNVIYSDYPISHDLVVHESTYFKQQEKYGLDEWVRRYLEEDDFRLLMEVEAYRKQLGSINNKGKRKRIKKLCCKDLSSALYGNLLTFDEAMKNI